MFIFDKPPISIFCMICNFFLFLNWFCLWEIYRKVKVMMATNAMQRLEGLDHEALSWGWLKLLPKFFWEQKNCQLSVRSDQTRSADRLRWTGHVWVFLLWSAGQVERERSEEKFGIPQYCSHDSVKHVGSVSAGVFLFIWHSSGDIRFTDRLVN